MALNVSCTRAACVARASVSVRMVGTSCLPSASARFWRIAKTGVRFPVAGLSVVRSCCKMASSCRRLSRWNLPVADQSFLCDQRR